MVINLYSFGNNPMNLIDPYGLEISNKDKLKSYWDALKSAIASVLATIGKAASNVWVFGAGKGLGIWGNMQTFANGLHAQVKNILKFGAEPIQHLDNSNMKNPNSYECVDSLRARWARDGWIPK